MPYAILQDPALWSYGFGTMVFAAFAVRLSLRWHGGPRASILLCTTVASALWAGCAVADLAFPAAGLWGLARFLDAIRLGAWLAFMLVLLERWGDGGATATRIAIPLWQIAGLAALLVAGAILPQTPPWLRPPEGERGAIYAYGALLAVSVIGLALTEQLYRRTPDRRRWAIKPLVIGLGGMFALDLLMYSDAILFRHLDPALWAARGIAHALVMLFVAVATARNTEWTVDLHVSRGVVFHSTAVLATGTYLLIVAGAAYWVRFAGGGWGGILQVAFVFSALLGLAALALSGTLRSWLRVFVSKHFFAYRYDYRREWLQFTHMLGTSSHGEQLAVRVLRALANLVESLGGAIWLERGGAFCQVARLNLPEVREAEPASGMLASFLRRTGWVIQIDELQRSPDRYPDLVVPNWLADLTNAWLVVPLSNGADLIGFVVLARPRVPIDVNWEVLDLLKTAGRQAASYLAQMEASEALLDVEKFDAFNRMSAFVVHDLKNLVAQLALLLKNAERHRDNPEFQQDMLETVEHVVGRMNHLMLQLHSGTKPIDKPRPVDLGEVIERIIRTKAGLGARIDVENRPGLRALAHEDRIERVIGHIVQNAVEAAQNGDARVGLRTYRDDLHAVVEIVDNGVGMSEAFVRERLFRPFQTTKPQGMGIGMNESYQYVSGIGGRISVESNPGRGTRFCVILPLADVSAQAGEPLNQTP